MTRHEQLIELRDVYGFREKTVEAWPEDRITTVLAARRRDARLATKMGDHKAALLDGGSLGGPSKLEREMAAAWLERAMDEGGDAVVNAVLYCGHCLTDAEAKDFAAQLVATFRGDA